MTILIFLLGSMNEYGNSQYLVHQEPLSVIRRYPMVNPSMVAMVAMVNRKFLAAESREERRHWQCFVHRALRHAEGAGATRLRLRVVIRWLKKPYLLSILWWFLLFLLLRLLYWYYYHCYDWCYCLFIYCIDITNNTIIIMISKSSSSYYYNSESCSYLLRASSWSSFTMLCGEHPSKP